MKFEEGISTRMLREEGKEHRREKRLQGKRRIFKAKWL